ncbi:cell wall hydrolase [Sphingomonas lutea]|uniref:Cell wall hydrolase n=2 Tax=Sphingomonas lutea TaxID=1045317 RepID=A0A7G9SKT1_9SPHN|nr:cell wall hydrolase [Sphingomonas lutea]
MVVCAAVAGFLLSPTRQPANAATYSVPLTPARAASLVQATTGEAANDMQAIGDRAKVINAALPFASGPLLSARPFAAAGSDVDQRRALLCLTQAVYYEAGFEPMDGRRAVAQVILNRMRHPAFPKSICGVVYQNNGRICQFTFVCDGALTRRPAGAAWQQAETIARAALAGYVEKSVGSATHYHANYVAPRWAPLLAKVSQLGQHIFYRWPGSWGQPAAFTGRYVGEPRDPLSLRPVAPAVFGPITADAVTAAPVVAGPPVPRAENDVGGLLDTTKGWTLSIPDPRETSGAASKLIAAQERKAAKPVETAAAGTVAGAISGTR